MNLTFTNHTLPIGEIKITKEFSRTAPHLDKLKKCMDFYRTNGYFDRQIIVDSENYLRDGYCAYITAVLLGVEKVKVLMVGENPVAGNPVTGPVTESKPEPIKLYCVESWMPGSWITKGKIYEIKSNGRIRFDDGYFPTWKSLAKPSMQTKSLFPLVRRPAKVGEWVYVTGGAGKHAYTTNRIYKVFRVCDDFGEHPNSVFFDDDGRGCVNPSEYFVLDGYRGGSE